MLIYFLYHYHPNLNIGLFTKKDSSDDIFDCIYQISPQQARHSDINARHVIICMLMKC
jgi:hypothetical protein